MNPEKSKLKILWSQALGVRFDDMKEAAEKDLHELKGSEKALRAAEKAILALHSHLEKDVEDGLCPGGGDLEVVNYVKRYIARAAGALENLAQKSVTMQHVANGKLSAMDTVVKLMKKEHDNEVTKLENMIKLIDAGVDRPDVAVDASQAVVSAAADIQERRDAAKKEKAEKAKDEGEKKPKRRSRKKTVKEDAKNS